MKRFQRDRHVREELAYTGNHIQRVEFRLQNVVEFRQFGRHEGKHIQRTQFVVKSFSLDYQVVVVVVVVVVVMEIPSHLYYIIWNI